MFGSLHHGSFNPTHLESIANRYFTQGSGFIAYSTIMAILLVVGEAWVRRSGRSPEFYDSWVITVWGIGK